MLFKVPFFLYCISSLGYSVNIHIIYNVVRAGFLKIGLLWGHDKYSGATSSNGDP